MSLPGRIQSRGSTEPQTPQPHIGDCKSQYTSWSHDNIITGLALVLCVLPCTVRCQWCGLRPSVLGQDRSETKIIGLGLGLARCGLGLAHYGLGLACCGLGLGLAGLVLCCETRSCHARRRNDLEGRNTFQVLFIVSLFCALNISNYPRRARSALGVDTVLTLDVCLYVSALERKRLIGMTWNSEP